MSVVQVLGLLGINLEMECYGCVSKRLRFGHKKGSTRREWERGRNPPGPEAEESFEDRDGFRSGQMLKSASRTR